jgi:hypothetical protein
LIVFLHHHLTIGYDQPQRAILDRDTAGTTAPVRDAASVLGGLREYGVQVVFHGHLHCPAYEIYDRQVVGEHQPPIHIVSAGSPSVAARHCGTNASGDRIHHFQILEFVDSPPLRLVIKWFVAPASKQRVWNIDREIVIPLRQPPFFPDTERRRQRRLEKAVMAARNRDAFDTVLTMAALMEGDTAAYRQIRRAMEEAVREAEKQNRRRPNVSGEDLKALFDKAVQSLKKEWADDPKAAIHSRLTDPANGAIRFAHDIILERMMKLNEDR